MTSAISSARPEMGFLGTSEISSLSEMLDRVNKATSEFAQVSQQSVYEAKLFQNGLGEKISTSPIDPQPKHEQNVQKLQTVLKDALAYSQRPPLSQCSTNGSLDKTKSDEEDNQQLSTAINLAYELIQNRNTEFSAVRRINPDDLSILEELEQQARSDASEKAPIPRNTSCGILYQSTRKG